MYRKLTSFTKKTKLMLVGAVLALTVAAAGSATVAQPQTALASGCDQFNIVYCGVSGTDTASKISSFKQIYARNSDNGHTDLHIAYDWAGLSAADVSGMNTSNTKLGTLYRNGQIVVGGKVVATDAWISGRRNTDRAGFTRISNDIWVRKATTASTYDSDQVLVHYLPNGTVDTAVMTRCGNSVKATPVPVPPAPKPKPPVPPAPAPKPVLVCSALDTPVATSTKRTYTFTAHAAASNTSIVSYVFNYGDGKTATVTTSATTATATHTFAADNTSYRVTVSVNGTVQKNVTSAYCVQTVKTPPAVVKPALVCSSLAYTEVKDQPLTYTFVARAVATKTTITSYVYHFGDGKTLEVKTGSNTASAVHTYTENNKTFVAYVEVNSTDFKNVTSATCKIEVKTPKPEECKPGIPTGDTRCNECKPGIPAGDERCTEVPTPPEVTPPATLVNTGAGSIASLFAGTSVLGAFGHRLFMKRRMAR